MLWNFGRYRDRAAQAPALLSRRARSAALTDERVAVGESLGARDVRAEKLEERRIGVLPHDRARPRIDLDHAREGPRVIAPVGAVVEDEQVQDGTDNEPRRL